MGVELLQTVTHGYRNTIVPAVVLPILQAMPNDRDAAMLQQLPSRQETLPREFALPLAQQRLETGSLERLLQGWPVQRRCIHDKQHVFRAGQPRQSLFFVHAGFFKTCLISEDGREKITGFRMRGDLLGIDALDMATYACDAVALDTGELWELPYAQMCDGLPDFQQQITSILAGEIRRDWSWMLATATLTAEQRVIAFLLDLGLRLEALGFSAHWLLLRMTRAEMGNFLSIKLETVTRALSQLQARGLIHVAGREIRIKEPGDLRALVYGASTCH